MTRTAITAPGAAAVGPYSHAIDSDGLVFLSGRTPLDPTTEQLVVGPVDAQARQCFANLVDVLAAAGLDCSDVFTCNVVLTDMDDFAAMNAAPDGGHHGASVRGGSR